MKLKPLLILAALVFVGGCSDHKHMYRKWSEPYNHPDTKIVHITQSRTCEICGLVQMIEVTP